MKTSRLLSISSIALLAATTWVSTAHASDPNTPDPNAPYPPKPPTFAPPRVEYTYSNPRAYPSLLWFATQFVPSPEVGFGRSSHTDWAGVSQRQTDAAFGFRWQLTPILWSWGVHRAVSPWRFVVVDPLARFSGSIEADMNLEYFLGHVNRMIVRPSIVGNFPLFHRGEYLSMSMGTSAYVYDSIPHVAYEGGIYTLFGLFGAQFTYAPSHEPLRAIATFRIRYF